MLKRGVIEKSNSSLAAGLVSAKKKDGYLKFFVDYRSLNDVTVKDVYPLPKIDKTLNCLGLDARKPDFGDLRTTQAQTSLRIRAV